MTSRPPFEEIVKDLTTTSDKIRALARAGYLRKEISKLLEIRYQHVRQVLADAGIEGGLQRGVEAESPPIIVEPPEAKTRAETSWDVLLKAGVQHVGNWLALPDGTIKIDGKIPAHPGVYALVLDGVVVYVGLTLNGLQTRMDQYRRGHKGQRTSARVCSATIWMGCARSSWRVLAGASPARVRGSARLVVSVAAWAVTTTAKRTQQSCGAWE